MEDDYRNTMYCPALGNITERKRRVEEKIKNDHKKAKDMHRYLCRNEDKYKGMFVSAYNKKCSYWSLGGDNSQR